MFEGNFETNQEKKYSSQEEALIDLLGKTPQEFIETLVKSLGARASRKAFFINECMHKLPDGSNMNGIYKIGEEEYGVTDLLEYLFEHYGDKKE